MKAIETEYKGYKFRSRLEARWAVFFDAIGIKWEYEPEGYQFEDGTMYLPDFYLLDLKTYVEIKPESDREVIEPQKFWESNIETENKYSKAAYNFTINGFMYWIVFGDPKSALTETTDKNYLFCTMRCFFHDMAIAKDNKNMRCENCDTKCFECEHYEPIVGSNVLAITKESEFFTTAEDMYNNHVVPMRVQNHEFDDELKSRLQDAVENTIKAATKARQARFEHGEQPFVNSEIIKLESIEDKLEKLYDICDTSTESGRIDFLKKASNIIAEEKSRLSREVYIQSVCKKVDMPYVALTTEVDMIVKRNRYANKNNTWHNISSEDKNIRRTKLAEEMIIHYLLKRPQEWEDVEKAAPPDCFVTPFHKRVYSALLEKMRETDKFTLLMLNGEFNQEEMGRISGIAAKNSELPMTFEGVLDCAELLKKFKPTPSNKLSSDELINLFKSKNKERYK